MVMIRGQLLCIQTIAPQHILRRQLSVSRTRYTFNNYAPLRTQQHATKKPMFHSSIITSQQLQQHMMNISIDSALPKMEQTTSCMTPTATPSNFTKNQKSPPNERQPTTTATTSAELRTTTKTTNKIITTTRTTIPRQMTVDNKQKEFEQYLNDHNVNELFNELTEALVVNKPENPIDFIINELEAKRRNQPFRKVVFVLGGPGSGKGTQCARLVEQFGFVHFSAGDLLRAEAESDSDTGRMISTMIREGQIVPGHITIGLLRKAIFSHPDSETTTFLIDGFPREMKQALDFERQVTPCQFVLFFECPEQVLEERLLNRGLTSGRSDDNIVSIRKRFQTYQKQTMPVIDYFSAHDKVKRIDTSKTVHQVFDDVRTVFGL